MLTTDDKKSSASSEIRTKTSWLQCVRSTAVLQSLPLKVLVTVDCQLPNTASRQSVVMEKNSSDVK